MESLNWGQECTPDRSDIAGSQNRPERIPLIESINPTLNAVGVGSHFCRVGSTTANATAPGNPGDGVRTLAPHLEAGDLFAEKLRLANSQK